MSHLIKTSIQTYPSQLLLGEIYEIKAPSMMTLSRQFNFQRFSVDESARTIAQMVARQSKCGITQNEQKLHQSLITLKKRLRGFGVGDRQHIPFNSCENIHRKKLTCQPTESVDIKKKYNVELTVKFNALTECENIESYRKEMNKWANNRHNSVGSNPNFSKMNYLITRAREGDKEKQIFTPANNLQSKTGEQIIGLSRPLKQLGRYRGLLSLNRQVTQP